MWKLCPPVLIYGVRGKNSFRIKNERARWVEGEIMVGLLENLPVEIKRHVEKILRDIEQSGSMILVVKNGAKAEGFMLGVECSGGLSAEDCELLSIHFDHATEKRLRTLALGL